MHEASGERVAIKIINFDLIKEAKDRKRVAFEVEIIQKLNHFNVIHMLECV